MPEFFKAGLVSFTVKKKISEVIERGGIIKIGSFSITECRVSSLCTFYSTLQINSGSSSRGILS